MEAGVEPRVFVTNFAGHDYAEAEKFGKLIFITRGYISFQSLDRVKYVVTEEVHKSRPHDWLLLSGTPIIAVIAAVAWYFLHKEVRLLIHDRKIKDKIMYRQLILNERNFHHLYAALAENDGTQRDA